MRFRSHVETIWESCLTRDQISKMSTILNDSANVQGEYIGVGTGDSGWDITVYGSTSVLKIDVYDTSVMRVKIPTTTLARLFNYMSQHFDTPDDYDDHNTSDEE